MTFFQPFSPLGSSQSQSEDAADGGRLLAREDAREAAAAAATAAAAAADFGDPPVMTSDVRTLAEAWVSLGLKAAGTTVVLVVLSAPDLLVRTRETVVDFAAETTTSSEVG